MDDDLHLSTTIRNVGDGLVVMEIEKEKEESRFRLCVQWDADIVEDVETVMTVLSPMLQRALAEGYRDIGEE